MALKVVEYSRSRRLIVLTKCPSCGYEFDRHERRFIHFATHDPEDFGLAPVGEEPDGIDEPTFGGVRP